MKTYLFLLAWVDGSDGASGDPTGVHSKDDLLPEYQKASEYIFCLRIQSPNKGLASTFGYRKAFFNNYTNYDTTSVCLEIDGVKVPNSPETPLVVVDCQEE